MAVLDEALLAVDGVWNFQAVLAAQGGADRLAVRVQAVPRAGLETAAAVKKALLALPVVAANVGRGSLTLAPVEVEQTRELAMPVKRMVQDLRSQV